MGEAGESWRPFKTKKNKNGESTKVYIRPLSHVLSLSHTHEVMSTMTERKAKRAAAALKEAADGMLMTERKAKRAAAALKEAADGMLAEAEVLMQASKRLRQAAKKALREAGKATRPKAPTRGVKSDGTVVGGGRRWGHVGMGEPENAKASSESDTWVELDT